MICRHLAKCNGSIATQVESICKPWFSLKQISECKHTLNAKYISILTSIVNCKTVLHTIKHPHAYCAKNGKDRNVLNFLVNLEQL